RCASVFLIPGSAVHSQRKRDQSSLNFCQLLNHVSQWSHGFGFFASVVSAVRSPITATRSFRLTRDSHSYKQWQWLKAHSNPPLSPFFQRGRFRSRTLTPL